MRVAVIGGGAAGLIASGVAAERGADVVCFEKNDRYGVKLRITGKGRCNVTNNCGRQEFFDNVVSNPRFLYSAYSKFDTGSVMDFFEGLGVPLKTERGSRVFPVSDKASDIADALISYCKKNRVKMINEKVVKLSKNGDFIITTANKEYVFDKVIVATGGLSYPKTGSTGDGYAFAKAFGHSVTELSPSLVPLICGDDICGKCQGLSLKNVQLSVCDTVNGKTVYCEQGEMLFTDSGVSGPLVLSASAHMNGKEQDRYKIYIDLKPALDIKTLDKRILRDFSENKNKDIINAFSALLPSKLIAPFIELTGIPRDKKVNSVTAKERERIAELLKHLPLMVKSKAPIAEAVITRGGIDTKQIDPKTMQSKLIPGLYFAGEIIDCDAYTGGFNLQIAFCTGYTAGISLSE